MNKKSKISQQQLANIRKLSSFSNSQLQSFVQSLPKDVLKTQYGIDLDEDENTARQKKLQQITQYENDYVQKAQESRRFNMFDTANSEPYRIKSFSEAAEQNKEEFNQLFRNKWGQVQQVQQDDIYSKQKQNAYSQASEITRKYDTAISDLESQKNDLIKQKNDYIQSQVYDLDHISGTQALAINHNPYDNKINKLDSEIKELKRRRNKDVNAFLNYTDPDRLFNNNLAKTMYDSDDMSKAEVNYTKAMSSGTSVAKNFDSFWNKLFATKEEENVARAALSDIMKADYDRESLSKQYNQVIDYVTSIKYLPKTLEEFPVQLRAAAKSAFTKNGKFLLNDPEYRKEFNLSNLIDEDQFKLYRQIANEIAKQPDTPVTSESFKRAKEEIETLATLTDMDVAKNQKYEYNTSALGFGGASIGLSGSDDRVRNYDAAMKLLEEAENHQRLYEGIVKNNAGALHAAGYALGDFFFKNDNPLRLKEDIYTFGFNSLFTKDIPTLSAASDLAQGKELSIDQKALLRAKYLEDAMHSQYGAYEDRNAFKWTKIAAESLQFMAEFIATSGMLNAAQRTGSKLAEKGIEKMATSAARKAVAKSMGTTAAKIAIDNPIVKKLATELVEKYSKRAVAGKLLRGATRLGADAAYAAELTSTLGSARTIGDAVKDVTGTVDATEDYNGHIILNGMANQENPLDAFSKSFKRNFIENFSELMGEWGIGKGLVTAGKKLPGLGNMLSKMENHLAADAPKLSLLEAANAYIRHGVGNMNGVLARNGLRKYIPNLKNIFNKQLLKQGQFHGFLGEVAEEYYGLIMQHMLGVQDDPNANLWQDVRNQSADIWGGIAVSTGLLGGFSMIGSAASQRHYQKQLDHLFKAFGPEVAEEIQRKMIFADAFSIQSIYNELLKAYGKPEAEVKEKSGNKIVDNIKSLFGLFKNETLSKAQALTRYKDALLHYRGSVYGEELIKKYVTENIDNESAEALKAGYRTANYRSKRQADAAVGILQKDADQLFDGTTVEQLREDHDKSVNSMIIGIKTGKIALKPGVTEQEAINAVIAYNNAVEYRNGIDMSMSDLGYERATKRSQVALRLAHQNEGESEGTIRVLNVPVRNEKGELEVDENGNPTDRTESVFWIGGNIKTVAASDEINTDEKSYEHGDDYVLVADALGNYQYIKRSKLQGAKIDPHKYNVQRQMDLIYQSEIKKQWKERDQYLKSKFGIRPEVGEHLFVDGKRVTILDANPMRGITYSVSDENGKNAQIYHAEDVNNLNQFIESLQAHEGQELTEQFNKRAEELNDKFFNAENRTKAAMVANSQHVEDSRDLANRQAYYDRDGVVDENDERDDSDAYFPEKEEKHEEKPSSTEDKSILSEKDKKLINKLKEYMRKLKKNAYGSILPIQPLANAALGIAVAGVYLKAGIKSFGTYVKEILRQFGNEYEEPILDNIKQWTNEALQNKKNTKGWTPEEVNNFRHEMDTTDVNSIVEPEHQIADANIHDIIGKSEQREQAVANLINEAADSQQHKIATSGYHYFIHYRGKVRLARRVHSIIGDRYSQTPKSVQEEERASEYYNRLKSITNPNKLKEEVEKIINEIREAQLGEYDFDTRLGGLDEQMWSFVERELRMSLQLDKYAEYLKNNPSEHTEIIKGLSEILTNSSNPSVIAGNIYDQLCKIVLDTKTEKVPDYDDARWTILFYGEPTHISTTFGYTDRNNVTTPRPLMTRAAFEAAVKELIEIKKYFAQQGIELVSNVSYFHFAELYQTDLKTNKVQSTLVAGESDIIGITKDGSRILIDVKTYRHTPTGGKRFYAYRDSEGYIHGSEFFKQASFSELNNENLTDQLTGETLLTKSQAAQYARQLQAYKMLHAQNGNTFVQSLVLLLGIDYQFLGDKNVAIDETGDRGNISMSALRYQPIDSQTVIPNIVRLDQIPDGLTSDEITALQEDMREFNETIMNIPQSQQEQLLVEIKELVATTNGEDPDLDADIEAYNQQVLNLNKLDLTNHDTFVDVRNRLLSLRNDILDRFDEYLDMKERERQLNETIRRRIEGAFGNSMLSNYQQICEHLCEELKAQMIHLAFIVHANKDVDTEFAEDMQMNCNLLEQLLQLNATDMSINLTDEIVRKARTFLDTIYKHYPGLAEFVAEDTDTSELQQFGTDVKRKYWQYTNLSDHAANAKTISESKAEDGYELKNVISAPNFVNDATFTIIRVETENPNRPKFEMEISFGGRTFSPVTIYFAKQGNVDGTFNPNKNTSAARILYNQLCEATSTTNRVVINNDAIKRSTGIIQNAPTQNQITLDGVLETFGIHSWSEVKYEEGGKFGITKTKMIDGVPRVVAMTPRQTTQGDRGEKRVARFVYTRENESVHPPVGGVVAFYTPKYNELKPGDNSVTIPVNLESQLMTNEQAQLIVDLLSGKYSSDGATIIQPMENVIVNGNRLPISNGDLLSLFITKNFDAQKGEKCPVSIVIDERRGTVSVRGTLQGINSVSYNEDGTINEFISREYHTDVPEDMAELKDFLMQNVRVNISEEFMKRNLGKNSMFTNIAQWFNETGNTKLKIGGVEIVNKEELEDGPESLSGLGYYMKRGFLKTEFLGTDTPLLRIDELESGLDSKEQTFEETVEESMLPIGEKPIEDINSSITDNDTDDEDDDEYWAHTENREEIESLKRQGLSIDELEAVRIIRQICGDDVDIKFTNDVLAIVQNGVVVGACYRNVIKLSRLARTGVAYHEAFHRVLELLVSEKLRNKAYNKYREKFGEDLTDAEIAELAADDFWWYMEHKPEKFKFSLHIGEMFKQLKNWYNFYTKVGSFTLWRLYRNAAAGKYKNSKPDAETISRFKKLAKKGYLAKEMYTTNGFQFSSIMNRLEFDAVTETVRMIVTDPKTYKDGKRFDRTGKHFEEVTMDMLRYSDKTLEILESDLYTKDAKLKLCEYLDISVKDGKIVKNEHKPGSKGNHTKEKELLQYILSDLTKSQINTKKVEVKKSNSTVDQALSRGQKDETLYEGAVIDTEGTEKEKNDPLAMDDTLSKEGGEFTKVSAEFEPITRASARVKLFFSLLTDYEMVPTVSKKGVVRREARAKKNAAGLPQNINFKTAWGIMLNKLYNCRDPYEIYTELESMSKLNPAYAAMFKEYKILLSEAFETRVVKDFDGNVAYKTWFDENGHTTKVINHDAFGLINEISSVLNHAKNIPLVIQFMNNRTSTDENGTDLSKSIHVQQASMNHMCRKIRSRWSDLVASGQGEIISKDDKGRYSCKDKKLLRQLAHNIKAVLDLFKNDQIPQYLLKNNFSITVDGVELALIPAKGKNQFKLDIYNSDHLQLLLGYLVKNLQRFGINTTVEDMQYMINTYYGGVNKQGLQTFANVFYDDITTNIIYINPVGKNGKEELKHKSHLWLMENCGVEKKNILTGTTSRIVSSDTISHIFNNDRAGGTPSWSRFIDNLAKAQFERESIEKQTMFVTIGGKKQYAMCEPNYITDTIVNLTDWDSEELAKRLNDPYYCQSELIRQISQQETPLDRKQVAFAPVPGYKSDLLGSKGVEYLDLSEKEDYVCKYGLLASNYIIFPTLSDKTTWGAITAPFLKVFGIDYTSAWDVKTYTQMIEYFGDNYQSNSISDIKDLTFNIDVLDRFINYATSEYNSAKRELSRITNFGDSLTVQSLDITKNKNVHQAARLSTFTGIIDDNGDFISFNDCNKTDAECLADANTYFFSQSKERQRQLMNRVLALQVERELQKLEELGLIKQTNNIYQNLSLDRAKVQRVQDLIFGLSNRNRPINSNKDVPRRTNVDATKKHRAVVAYVADMVIKNQMSMQESYRILGINPCSYKWKYAKTGEVQDTTTDMFKRLGGLVSTGAHNVRNVEGVDEDIICAEWKDTHDTSEMFGSFFDNSLVQQLKKHIRTVVYKTTVVGHDRDMNPIYGINMDNESAFDTDLKAINDKLNELANRDLETLKSLRASITNLVKIKDDRERFDKMWDLVKSLSLVEYLIKEKQDKQKLSEEEAIQFVKTVATTELKKNNAFFDYTVTDGFTLITPEMTKKLLIQLGKWDERTKKAFMLLEGYTWKDGKYVKSENATKSDEELRSIAEAYNDIYTSVIGTQKYTSYGLREEEGKYIDDDGEVQTYTRLIPYYEKTAYFPVFSCMASGYMKAILKKAQEQGIDVLRSNESMKTGGGLTTPLDRNTFTQWDSDPSSFDNYQFKTYVQKMSNVRKQFNTDPKEGHKMSLGTQYVKVLMSLIETGQRYSLTDQNGTEMSAAEVRDYVMTCITEICKAGVADFEQRFYDKNRNVDLDKFVDLLRRQLSDKDANDQIIQALEVEEVPDPENPGKTIKQFHIPIACMQSTSWIESIVTSVVNKSIVDIVSPGQAFYQRSAFGMEGMMSANWIDVDDFDYTINHGAELKEINEEGSADIVLSIDYFDYLWEGTALEYQSFEAKKAWLIKHGIISGFGAKEEEFTVQVGDVYIDDLGHIVDLTEQEFEIKEGQSYYDTTLNKEVVADKTKRVKGLYGHWGKIGKPVTARKWHNAKANIVGYRIPTQAVSSIHALRCVDVIPVVRHTVILPKEITAVTGSDFDIDKFFLSTLYYRNIYTEEGMNKMNQLAQRIGFDSYSEFLNRMRQTKKSIDKLEKKKNSESGITEEQEVELGELKKQLEQYEFELSTRKAEDGTLIEGEDYIWRNNNYLDDKYDDAETPADKYKQQVNKLLRAQIDLLKTTDNNLSQLRGSIDSDTSKLIEMDEDIQSESKKESLMPFEMSSLRTNITAKMSFAIGKHGIGPFALNNNNHVYTMLYNVKFKNMKKREDDILRALDLQSLGDRYDKNGDDIMSWLSALINAHVDVAKDPYIRRLGVNTYTYNLANLLIRTGYGKQTFYFLTQPIMKAIYKAHDEAAGIYHVDDPEMENKSVFTRTSVAVQKEFVQFLNDHINERTFTKATNYDAAVKNFKDHILVKYKIDPKNFLSIVTTIMNSKVGVEALRSMSKTPISEIDYTKQVYLNDDLTMTVGEIQACVGIAQFMLQNQAQNLSNLVQYTKIDTKKQGITLAEQQHYFKQFEKLYKGKNPPFTREVENMIRSSFIEYKTKAAINAVRKLMSGQLIQATTGYSQEGGLEQSVIEALGQNREDTGFRDSVRNMIISKLKMDYFLKGPNSYCIRRAIDPVELFVSSKKELCLYDELPLLIAKIENNPEKYKMLVNSEGKCNNYLLQKLMRHEVNDVRDRTHQASNTFVQESVLQDKWDGAKFVTINTIGEDFIKTGDLQHAWEDLLNCSQCEDVQRFAERLVVYSFLTGTTGTGYDLTKYVPDGWISGNCNYLRVEGRSARALQYNRETGEVSVDTRVNAGSFADYVNNVIRILNQTDENGVSLYAMPWSDSEIEEMILHFSWDKNIIPEKDAELVRTRLLNIKSDVIIPGMTKNPLLFCGLDSNRRIQFADDDGNFPSYIKVKSDIKGAVGEVRYNYYKLVSFGLDTSGTDPKRYPIYAMIQPSGGTYAKNQRIMAIGSQVWANDKFDFSRAWEPCCKRLLTFMNGLQSGDKYKDPRKMFAKLFDLMLTDQRVSIAVTKQAASVFGTLNMNAGRILSDIINDKANTGAQEVEDDGFEQGSEPLLIHEFDYEKASTLLLADGKDIQDMHYTRLASATNKAIVSIENYETASQLFNKERMAYITQSLGVHVEFYKIQHTGENKYFTIAMTLSLPHKRGKGFIQINADFNKESKTRTGRFVVDFKTYSTDMKRQRDAFGATVPLNENDKRYLLNALIAAIPENGIISINQNITKHAKDIFDKIDEIPKRLAQANNPNLKNTGTVGKIGEETVNVVTKKGKNVESQEVQVPVWQKSVKFEHLYTNPDVDAENVTIENGEKLILEVEKTSNNISETDKQSLDMMAYAVDGITDPQQIVYAISALANTNQQVRQFIKNTNVLEFPEQIQDAIMQIKQNIAFDETQSDLMCNLPF